MKKSLFIPLSVIIVLLVFGFTLAKPTVDWPKTTHDFGKIEQGTPVSAEFEFKNTSMVPLVITNVHASCGCTVPDYPKEPIKPGETSKLTATFNAKSLGHFSKSITVNTNAVEPVQVLYIKGEVMKK